MQRRETRETYEYHFKYLNPHNNYYSFSSIGWEDWRHPQKYVIDHLNAQKQQFVFQYTVSGEGAITINSRTYALKPRQAFLIESPSYARYYLPKSSSHWELKFLTLNAAGHDLFRNLINEYGNVYTLPESSAVMEYWEELYQLSQEGKILDFFTASSYAYSFVMQLSATLRRLPGVRHSSNRLQTCLDTIHANYQDPLTLKQLSEICCLSPSYLTKLFKDNFHVTPIQYLIQYRIKAACHLLLQEDLRIETIALQTGFGSSNYFSRIFRQVMGVSPKDYRRQEHTEALKQEEMQQLVVRYEVTE